MTGIVFVVINVVEHSCPKVSYTSSHDAQYGMGEKVYDGGYRSCLTCYRCKACIPRRIVAS